MSRLVILVLSVVAGAVLAVAVGFGVTGVLSGLHSSPVNKSLYSYGTR